VPNQALSDQRRAIWIGRQCFFMRNKIIIHANKMNALKTVLKNPQIDISTFCDQPDVTSCSSHFRRKTVLINPQIEISTFCDQPNVTSYFSPKIKTKSFHHF
jgi:hypothetical protein